MDENIETVSRLSNEQIENRVIFLTDQEANEPEAWWWCSFADPTKPKGQQFLGVVIVRGRGPISTHQETWARGCNPGGEAQFMRMDGIEVPVEYANRLLSRKEAERVDALISS